MILTPQQINKKIDGKIMTNPFLSIRVIHEIRLDVPSLFHLDKHFTHDWSSDGPDKRLSIYFLHISHLYIPCFSY